MNEFMRRMAIDAVGKYGPNGDPAMGAVPVNQPPYVPAGPHPNIGQSVNPHTNYTPDYFNGQRDRAPMFPTPPVQGPPNNTARSVLPRPANPDIAMARAQNPGRGAGPSAPPQVSMDNTGNQMAPDDMMAPPPSSTPAVPSGSRVAGDGFVPTSQQPGLMDLFTRLMSLNDSAAQLPTESPPTVGMDPAKEALRQAATGDTQITPITPGPAHPGGPKLPAGANPTPPLGDLASPSQAGPSGAPATQLPTPNPMQGPPMPQAPERGFKNASMKGYDSTVGVTDPLTAAINKMFGVNQNNQDGSAVRK